MKDGLYQMIADASGLKPDAISNGMSFTNDLGLSSLDVLLLVMKVEKKFRVSIPDDDYENMHTVGALEFFCIQKS